jgi:CubicO group peptidase (beta-lactamase class C family)
MRFLTFLVFFFLHVFSFAQSAGTEKVNVLVQNFMSKWDIPGGEIAIAKNGKLICSRAFGFADTKKQLPVRNGDLFRIASVSKPITAIAVMKLVQEHKLALDDTVFGRKKILDQPYYLGVISDKRLYAITVRQLLEHTAGWDRSVPCDGYPHSDAPFFPLHVAQMLHEPMPIGDSALIKFSLLRGLNHTPGKVYAYSNVGYLVLGKIVEKISGMDYATYVQKNILEPLSVNDMHLGKNLLADKDAHEVCYYGDYSIPSCYGDGKTVPSQYGGFNLEAMNAHGGWLASAGDLTKILSSLDCSESAGGILCKDAISQMLAPSGANANYAKGWCINKSGTCWHTGSIDGTAAFVGKTSDGYTWAFLFNSRADNSPAFWKALDQLPWQCLDSMHGKIASANP